MEIIVEVYKSGSALQAITLDRYTGRDIRQSYPYRVTLLTHTKEGLYAQKVFPKIYNCGTAFSLTAVDIE